jgi:hypothetical protein
MTTDTTVRSSVPVFYIKTDFMRWITGARINTHNLRVKS